MLGSDYCFDMADDNPVAAVDRVASLGSLERAQILGGSAARLLGVG
jgi:hypothetical protein